MLTKLGLRATVHWHRTVLSATVADLNDLSKRYSTEYGPSDTRNLLNTTLSEIVVYNDYWSCGDVISMIGRVFGLADLEWLTWSG